MPTSEVPAGTLYGIGVGPGDPELVTVKAARLITAADVVAYHGGAPGRSLARGCAAPYLRAGQIEEALIYPVTRGSTEHPGGYAGAIADFYTESAERLAIHLAAGRNVVLLAEGDPTLYSSYMHMHKRLRDRFECVIVPGITSVSASAAAAGAPLVEADEVLTILPGTLAEDDLKSWLARTDAAVFMKVSRNAAGIRAALESSGRLDEALYVRRASHPDQRVEPFAGVDPDEIPYMATVVLPGAIAAGDAVGATISESSTAQTSEPQVELQPPGEVVVVGLGPAGAEWLTPQARDELAAATDIIGYSTYVNRVPVRPGQRRHASDNRVEAQRAEFALDLARRGHRVAVVSSGDPGVFAMAAAVLEVRAEEGYADVSVRVLPGVTAANAVASRVGAPLGHDYCVLSLSDQLKPWPVILQRLQKAAEADLVLALYNPASKTRRGHIAEVTEVLLQHRDPATPVVVGRAVGSEVETIDVITLGELTAEHVDMRTLLIIGSSRTKAFPGPEMTTVFTPRHY
ncbi:precorrin-2 C20-methyltransferase/precorrin-3B C17-methyltransferase [Jatrophihabitans sp. GAS493]|uniref:precorrin-3B C(17)-methyltransferase n=1 Tax=Jatrophihabitans sp. GAS493 TaxID=1907575 RepID=UPI000BB89E90|nr:precorrin-3B C(17)-methyltransferase [Jatrophihabitans sp. GAS493]SOD74476.1 precorrin-2 C20-methyltransferase/precorrin-3B C17-methyltransferase [Jatrophihabitans sp. GAS493]